MLPELRGFLSQLINPVFAATAIRVAAIVGSILFGINHGVALVHGDMTRDRWLSALLTYCVPYIVNIHGQYTSYARIQQETRQDLGLSQPEPESTESLK